MNTMDRAEATTAKKRNNLALRGATDMVVSLWGVVGVKSGLHRPHSSDAGPKKNVRFVRKIKFTSLAVMLH